MYNLTGRVTAGAFAAVLIYLSIMAIKTGVIFGRGIPYKRADDRLPFIYALTAQVGFAIFLLAIAAGYEPVKILQSLFAI